MTFALVKMAIDESSRVAGETGESYPAVTRPFIFTRWRNDKRSDSIKSPATLSHAANTDARVGLALITG